jgi:hypothetical protein
MCGVSAETLPCRNAFAMFLSRVSSVSRVRLGNSPAV